MKKIKGDDLFGQLNAFLKGQGIDFSQSKSLASKIKKSCQSLSSSINKAGEALHHAKRKGGRQIERGTIPSTRKRLPNKQNTPKKQNMKAKKKAAKKPAKSPEKSSSKKKVAKKAAPKKAVKRRL